MSGNDRAEKSGAQGLCGPPLPLTVTEDIHNVPHPRKMLRCATSFVTAACRKYTHSSGIARLAFEAFYLTIELSTFCECIMLNSR